MSEGTPIIVKKKKAHAHGHHGGAWKVAYADFVTAMMAFFLVMWIMGMDAQTRSMVAGYFNDPNGFMRNLPTSRNIISAPGMPAKGKGDTTAQSEDRRKHEADQAHSLKKKIEAAIVASAPKDGYGQELIEGVEVHVTQEGLRIEFIEKSGEVFFELGSAEIRPQARRLIGKVAPILARSKWPMEIDGHTDSRPYPSPHYDNWDLSADRASAMRRALRDAGVPSSQVLAVRAHADRELRRPGDPYHFSNRRVSLLLPFNRGAGPELPKEVLADGVQAQFRQPLGIAPDPGPLGHRSK